MSLSLPLRVSMAQQDDLKRMIVMAVATVCDKNLLPKDAPTETDTLFNKCAKILLPFASMAEAPSQKWANIAASMYAATCEKLANTDRYIVAEGAQSVAPVPEKVELWVLMNFPLFAQMVAPEQFV